MPDTWVLVLLSLVAATVGTLGGVGGAMFLVPTLILFGVEPVEAAPLGIMAVGASSLSAAPRQLEDGLVHHRLGVTIELAASAGAIVGALIGEAVSGAVLSRLLGLVAIAAALSAMRKRGLRNPPHDLFTSETPGEWPGTLAGAYRLSDTEVVPYQAKRLPHGLVAMVGAGLISGLAGVGGGFVKTPALTEIMHVPVKVAAATTTFTVGITATVSMAIFAGQGRIDFKAAAAIVLGGLLGGILGSKVQTRLPPQAVRTALGALLLLVGGILLVVG
jgi:uncharacterized membrane protein YfcA